MLKLSRQHERAGRILNVLRHEYPYVSRRLVLQVALALAASATWPTSRAAEPLFNRTRFAGYPFALGVASGYPRHDAVTLWTRLAPQPLQPDGGLPPTSFDVRWEVADDETFRKVVSSGNAGCSFAHAHSVRVDVSGLAPARWYYYRFRAGNEVSPTGRTRTAEFPGREAARLKFAIGSCQNYEQGYYAAHRHLTTEDLDLMLFLGDYIYSDSWGDDLVRQHACVTAYSLDDYRVRYAQYRMDPDLRRMHELVPWAMIWDDGEVDNDWAADQSEYLDPAFLARRTAALQAYFEHMPMPLQLRPNVGDRGIYCDLTFGNLARICLLDDRLYRSHQACPSAEKGGGGNRVYVDECKGLADTDRTMLGLTQEGWLEKTLSSSSQRWNVIAQQTLLPPADSEPGSRTRILTDLWDGYPAARDRLIESLVRSRAANPLIVGGDIHATVAGDLHRSPSDQSTPIIASAFCTTSITSQGAPAGAFASRLQENPHLKFANTHQRGYLTFDLTHKTCRVSARLLDNEKDRASAIKTAANFDVEAGHPGMQLS